MAAIYSQPAAANYFTPSPHAHRSRGYRLCDQCNVPENPHGPRFRLCGGCMTAQYCSSECQRNNWAAHKTVCQHTASQISATKQAGAGYPDENLARHLRKFTSAHQDLLNWTGFQALQLKRVPSNVRQYALVIDLNYHASSSSDSLRRFSLARTSLIPRANVIAQDPIVADDIMRREERCRRAGGIGTLVILIQCAGISQVMPVEVDPPAKITWDMRADWEEVLRKFVSEARTDFKPISTTPRGIYYG